MASPGRELDIRMINRRLLSTTDPVKRNDLRRLAHRLSTEGKDPEKVAARRELIDAARRGDDEKQGEIEARLERSKNG